MLSILIFLVLCLHRAGGVGDMTLSSSVPVIDITPLRDLSTAPGSPFYAQFMTTLRQIDDAMRTFGFFIATGHDLERRWEPALDAARQLFSLPPAALADVAIAQTGVFGRGYLEKGKESGVASKHYELKEGYSYGHPVSPATATNLMEQRNVWPEGLPEPTISTFHMLFLECLRVGKLIGAALARTPGGERLDPRVLAGGDSISLMRVFHYFSAHEVPGAMRAGDHTEGTEPPEAAAAAVAAGRTAHVNVTVLGSSPHTDWGYLTVILQDDVGGLQFYRDGEWLDVPVVRHGLVVNGGDYLRAASGGTFVSPIHRVLSPPAPGAERRSFVFFLYPNYTSPVPQLPDHQLQGQGQGRGELTFNTLEVATTGEAAASAAASAVGAVGGGKSFGDYIVDKWKGVEVSDAA